MLIHLLIWAIRAATKDAGGSSKAPAIGSKRKTRVGQVALECPHCQALGLATQYNLDERTDTGWRRTMVIYECGQCRRTMNAEALHNDGTGVLTARQWDCPACRSKNPAVRSDCANCGARIS